MAILEGAWFSVSFRPAGVKGGGYVLAPVCREQLLLYCRRPGEARSSGQFDGGPVNRSDGRILIAGEIMEYDVSEIRLEDAETGVESQEVVELSTEFLGQVGGGNGGVIL